MNMYIQVFFESAWNASIVPFGSEATLYAMKAFGGHDMALAALLAVAGGVLGQMFNWGVGALMLWVKRSGKAHIMSDAFYAKAQRVFHRYLLFLLFFAWAPLLKFTVLAAGFLQVRPRTTLILVTAGYVLHYGWVIYG